MITPTTNIVTVVKTNVIPIASSMPIIAFETAEKLVI